jgi:hypothetical protein
LHVRRHGLHGGHQLFEGAADVPPPMGAQSRQVSSKWQDGQYHRRWQPGHPTAAVRSGAVTAASVGLWPAGMAARPD